MFRARGRTLPAMKRASVLVFSCGLLFGCKVSLGSSPSSATPDGAQAPDATTADAAATDEPATDEPATPTRTSPGGAAPKRTSPDRANKPKRTSPASKPASWSGGLAALDPTADDAFEAVTTLFVDMHPRGSTRASTVRVDLEQLLEFVDKTASVVDRRVQADPALRSAACDSAGFGCGDAPTEEAKAEIAALQARGVRYYYTGEGTMGAGVDYAGVAAAVDGGLDGPSRAYLAAEQASAIFVQRFDEGGYNGKPRLAVDALLAAEALAAEPGPYADIAPKNVASTRESYLRLCDAGEFETPACTVSKAARASYTSFAEAHPSSPSVPAIKAFVAAMKKRRWKATSAQLDKIVAAALAAKA